MDIRRSRNSSLSISKVSQRKRARIDLSLCHGSRKKRQQKSRFEILVMETTRINRIPFRLLVLLPPSLRQCPSWLRRIHRRRLSLFLYNNLVPTSMQGLVCMSPGLRLLRGRERRPRRWVRRCPREKVSWPHTWISLPHYRRRSILSLKLAMVACSLEDRSSKQITIPRVSISNSQGRESRREFFEPLSVRYDKKNSPTVQLSIHELILGSPVDRCGPI